MTQEVSMAAEEENLDLEDETPDARKGKKAAKHDSKGAADLDKVTDYVEEVEISNQNMGDTISLMNDRQQKHATEKQRKEKELSKVKITKEDVDLIMQEIEIPRSEAERQLREHKGDVVEALVAMTN